MSQDNVQLAHQASDAFSRRDLDAFLALMDEDVETVSRLVAIEGGYHGKDGVRRWWENLLDIYPDLTVDVIEVRDRGDFTLTQQRLHGRAAGSGTPVEETIWAVSEWREGKTVWWSPRYLAEADALEAAVQRARGP